MSIIQVDKNKYRIFVSDGFNLDGSRRRLSKTITTDLTGRDLKRFLVEAEFDFEDQVKKRDPAFQKLARGSLKEYCYWWLDHKMEIGDIEATTKHFYNKMIKNRIVPFAGNNRLDSLTNADMLDLMKTIKDSPAKTKSGKLSHKYVKHHQALLSVMFNDAVNLKILPENPMENVKLKTPKTEVRDNFYNFEDIKKLLELLPKASTKHQLAILLTMSIGNRIGELIALKWKDIDLQNMRISIYESNAYTPGSGSYIKGTKNRSSERKLAFPPVLVNLFLEHKEHEKVRREFNKDIWINKGSQEEDFVFTQEDGNAMFVGSIPKWFRKFIRRHDLKYITFHGLRHTNTTVLINKGINIVSVSHNLGHAKTSTTTDLYAHHIENIEDSMANIFNEIIIENQNGTKSGSKKENIRLIK